MVGVAILMADTSSLVLAQYQQPGYDQPSYGQPSYGQPTYTTPGQPGYTGCPSQQGYGAPQQGYGTPASPNTTGQALGAAASKAVGGGVLGTAVGAGTRHRNAAPFKRNDRMLEALPIGVVVFPGSGIAANLADMAQKLGIPVWRFDRDGAV